MQWSKDDEVCVPQSLPHGKVTGLNFHKEQLGATY